MNCKVPNRFAPRPARPAAYRVVVLAALLLSGCAAYKAAPLDLAQAARAFDARRLDEPKLGAAVARMLAAPPAGWPPRQWNRAQLLAVALTRNPELDVTRAEVRDAESREIGAGKLANPDLTLQSEYARHEAHPWLYGLSVQWLLRSTDRRRLDRDIARLEARAANFQLMEQSWTVRRDLAAALSAWENSRRRLAMLDSLTRSQDQLLAIATRRTEAGEDAPSDLLLARQARLDMEQQRAAARADGEAALSALARVLGLPPQALDGLQIDWPDWGEPPAIDANRQREVREQALLSRADLQIAIRGYAVSEMKLKRAIARQYPEFTLGPGYYWDHGIAKFPLDVGFTLPLNRNRGEIAEGLAARDLAGQRLLAQQAAIDSAIAAAERAESLARAQAGTARDQYASAQRLAELAALNVRLGAAGAPDEIVAEIIAARAQLAVIQACSELQSTRNGLEDVLHAPVSGPELALAQAWTSEMAGARP